MQLNIYVPEGKESLLKRLDTVSKAQGKPRNRIVIEALEQYLRADAVSMELGKYALGVTGSLSRRVIYDGRRKI